MALVMLSLIRQHWNCLEPYRRRYVYVFVLRHWMQQEGPKKLEALLIILL